MGRGPAEALLGQPCALGLGAHEGGVARAVRFAEGVAARDQRDGFLVVHRHPGESHADVVRGFHGVRLALGPFRVHVYQAHVRGAQRVVEVTLAVETLVGAEPFFFGAPVHVLFRLPRIRAATGETEGLEAHRLQRDVPRQHHQVGPGNRVAVFLFDRPHQATSLVEVGVVRPRIQRREPLLPGARTAATVTDPVGAGGVPCHADHQAAVVAEIGWPPVLTVGHQRRQVRLQRLEVELGERLGIVEILAHRVGQVRVLMQDLEVKLVGPPVAVRAGPLRDRCATGEGAFRCSIAVHEVLSL